HRRGRGHDDAAPAVDRVVQRFPDPVVQARITQGGWQLVGEHPVGGPSRLGGLSHAATSFPCLPPFRPAGTPGPRPRGTVSLATLRGPDAGGPHRRGPWPGAGGGGDPGGTPAARISPPARPPSPRPRSAAARGSPRPGTAPRSARPWPARAGG